MAQQRPLLIEPADLVRSIPGSDTGPVDQGLLQWAIETVSGRALAVTGRQWQSPDDVPYGVYPILNVAARRLYVNPDRYTREAEGDYSYGLDASVTKAAIFTPDEEASLREFGGAGRVKGIAGATSANLAPTTCPTAPATASRGGLKATWSRCPFAVHTEALTPSS